MKILAAFMVSAGLMVVAEVASANNQADEGNDYVNFRDDGGLMNFNPFDYDISHMTAAEREAFDAQRQSRQHARADLTAANMYGAARILNER